jgi:hypothetical protein
VTDLSPSALLATVQPGDTAGYASCALALLLDHWPVIVNQLILEGEYGEAVAEDLMELMGKLGEMP